MKDLERLILEKVGGDTHNTSNGDGDGKEQQKPDDASTKKEEEEEEAIGTKIGATTIGKINRRRKHPRR